MFNKCSPRSIFSCLFTVYAIRTYFRETVHTRRCPSSNFVASLPPFLQFFSFPFSFFFFFVPFILYAHRVYNRVPLFFPSPNFNTIKIEKRLERVQETFSFFSNYFNFFHGYFEGDGEFSRQAKTRETRRLGPIYRTC